MFKPASLIKKALEKNIPAVVRDKVEEIVPEVAREIIEKERSKVMKPLVKQKTVWLGVIPLMISAVMNFLVSTGVVPPGVPEAVAKILEVLGLGGGVFGIRQAINS